MALRYSPFITLGGFDNVAAPKFQMVPKGLRRQLRVHGYGRLRPRSRDETIAKVNFRRHGRGRKIVIKGLKAGTTFIEWVNDPDAAGAVPVANKLEVCVKEERRINTAFHYVRDNARHRTRRRRADLNHIIAGANAILDTQANVKITKKSSSRIKVDADLGTVVRYLSSSLRGAPHNVPMAEHEWDDVTAFADAAADFNVFFVWAYEQDATMAEDNANAGTIASQKNCLIEDDTTSVSRTLAHETVHLLGIDDGDDHVETVGNLMGPTNKHHRSLNRAQIRMINTSGN